MNKFKKVIIGALSITIIGSSSVGFASSYQIKSGDTYWKISQRYNVDVNELLRVNNANERTILYIGQTITIPDEEDSYYEVKWGDTLWIISQKLDVSIYDLFSVNGLNESSMIYPGQRLIVPNSKVVSIPEQPKTYVTYENHIVGKGETVWSISQKYGIPMEEIIKANNLSGNAYLSIGQSIKIPVYNVPVMKTLGPQYGEYLDWWSGAQYVIPTNATFKVVDFYTGKSFMAKRTIGANHADVETLTVEDTNKMKEVFGGVFTWKSRPIIIEYNGRRIAASMAGMPHAGNDAAPGGVYTSWRSDGYGAGTNLDYVKNNGMNGVFDIHFLNSTRHKDGQISEDHQNNIKISAGLIK